MRTWARWTARAALFTASFAAAGAASAGLASAGTTSGNHSVGGGNQVTAPISIPINACGNALALLGDAFGGCVGGAWASGGAGSWAGITSGNYSILGGNQLVAPVSVPVDVCGNAVAVLGGALAGCAGGAAVSGGGAGSHSARTSGNDSILGGNQAAVPVRAPVNVCGNAVGNARAGCLGGAIVKTSGYSYGTATTSGNHSILGGNQVTVPVSVPVDVCGNAAAVLGGALAGCAGGAWTGGPSGHWSDPGTVLYSDTAGRSSGAASLPRQSAAGAPLTGALGGLPRLPALAGLPMLPALAGLPTSASPLAGVLTSATRPVPANLLSADPAPAGAPGMSSSSLLALAAGAVLAGAATLVAAGRRLGARKAGR